MAKILVLHGPNLNLLGTREPEHYGSTTLDQINENISRIATEAGHELNARQSNAEHQLVNFVQEALTDKVEFILINPAAFTHTSVALRDALLASRVPFIEVHLSNVFQREEFRHHSFFSDIAHGVICGLGAQGYELAVQAAIRFLDHSASDV
jgi:3-dehydroquinate dehydratase-2